jgi:restriction endonuclease S subunit
LNENKIKPNKAPDVNYKVLGVSNEIGIFLNEKLQAEETNQSYFVVSKNEFCYNPYRINVGSIGLNTYDFDNQIISGAYIVFACKEDELNPKYLDILFKSKGFLNYVNDKANGGVRMNFKFEDMEAWEIPLPPTEEQTNIVVEIEKQKAITEGADLVLKNYKLSFTTNAKPVLIESIAKVRRGASPRPAGDPKYFGGNEYRWFKISDIPKDLKYTTSSEDYVTEAGKNASVLLEEGTLILTNSGATCGYPSILKVSGCIHDGFLYFTHISENIDLDYLFYSLKVNRDVLFSLAQTGTQPNLNTDIIKTFSIPLPEPSEQKRIVAELDKEMEVLEGLRKIKTEAQNKINQILADVWGVEFVEPENILVEDEQEN